MHQKAIIKSQYRAAMAMLHQAIAKCPAPLWVDASYTNPFWHVAYHVLYYTHLYLQPAADEFIPWEKHRDDLGGLKNAASLKPYSKKAVLEYHAFCLNQVEAQIDSVDLEAESGFNWLPFTKLELQFYNIRHIQQHTGELCERLGAHGDVEVGWVKMKESRAGSIKQGRQ
jgi:hypothetical protein